MSKKTCRTILFTATFFLSYLPKNTVVPVLLSPIIFEGLQSISIEPTRIIGEVESEVEEEEVGAVAVLLALSVELVLTVESEEEGDC